MASDIVKRIRALRPSTAIEREAADEIERLRTERESLIQAAMDHRASASQALDRLADRDRDIQQARKLFGAWERMVADRDALIAEALAESTTEAALYDGGTLGKRMAKILSRAPQGAADRVRAEAAAEALESARGIRAEMERDELDMHQIGSIDGLPQLSRVMLNGASRYAERLRKRAAELRENPPPQRQETRREAHPQDGRAVLLCGRRG